MNFDRYCLLVNIFKEGYKVDLKTLKIFNKKGRELKITEHKNRVPVISIKRSQFSVTEIIGVWMGMDVIDNYCILLDGNKNNFHPGNLAWVDKKTALQHANMSKSNLTYKKILKIKEITPGDLSKRDGTKGKLANEYGISKRHLYSIVHNQKWDKVPKIKNKIN